MNRWNFQWIFAPIILSTLVLGVSCKPRGKSEQKDISINFDRAFKGAGSFPTWAYDGGPNPSTEEGRKLIELHTKIPYFPGLSDAVYSQQMFRPAFGPIPWRLMQKPNSVQILFIGQDGTHIAEAAGRPATAGFGGRAQDLAAYFGVSSSAAFINAYAYTIKWQYGAFDTPVLSQSRGSQKFEFRSFTSNPVWLLTQDLDSPIVKWRNQLIDWIIENNKDSLKLIVLFGGAARDAAGSYIVSKNEGSKYVAQVKSGFSEAQIKSDNVVVPDFELVSAGSNKQTAVPLTKNGSDMLAAFATIKGLTAPDYKDPAKLESLHKAFLQSYANRASEPQNIKDLFADFSLPKGGIHGSGVIHPAQLGGYRIGNGIRIVNQDMGFDSGEGTKSIKGLRINDRLTINRDILVTQLPHPTALSMLTPPQASDSVAKGLEGFQKYAQAGWTIEAESSAGFENRYAKGEKYQYRRGDMGQEYYDFGAPNSRMVNVSTASRLKPDTIIFGTRASPKFNNTMLEAMRGAKPSSFPPDDEMWISRASSSTDQRRTTFDPGPDGFDFDSGTELAKLLKTSLPQDKTFIDRFAVNGDFGHYRGLTKNPEILILADPDGDDDLITSRALSGTRGQFLQSVMTAAGVNDRYLVLKTAPYSNYSTLQPSASPSTQEEKDWADIIEATKNYRKAVLEKILTTSKPKIIMTDGPWAAAELKRLYPSGPGPKVIEIQRDAGATASTWDAFLKQKSVGLNNAASALVAAGYASASFDGKMKDIPRSHLSYYARTWEGTSGDRVVTATDSAFKGKAFAEVAPKWAFFQKFKMVSDDVKGCEVLVSKMTEQNLRIGFEKFGNFTRRTTKADAKAICAKAAFAASSSSGDSSSADAIAQVPEEVLSLPLVDEQDPESAYVFPRRYSVRAQGVEAISK